MTFQTESRRNPSGIRPDDKTDSALSQPASQPKKNNHPPLGTEPVTRGARHDWLDSLAEVVAVLRPDWTVAGIRAAIGRSQASPRDRILNAITAASDGITNTPGRIEFYDRRRPTPIPPPYVPDRVDVAPMPDEIRAALADIANLKPLPGKAAQ